MLNFERELENDEEYGYEIDFKFYQLKYPKLKHFDISLSICQLFQPIPYNDKQDITIIFHKDACNNCEFFILNLFDFKEERRDYILNHDKIIRYMIYNNFTFNRNYFYEGVCKKGENTFKICFGT